MSSFNETIPAKNIQAGTGAASTTPETLDGAVNNRKARKGVKVKNNDDTIVIYVGGTNVSATEGYALEGNQSVDLEVEDPWNVWVVAASGTPGYSWIAH